MGAPTFVVEIRQKRKRSLILKKSFKLKPSSKRFSFADAPYRFLASIDISLATPVQFSKKDSKLDAFSAIVSALLDLDSIDSSCLAADTVLSSLFRKIGNEEL